MARTKRARRARNGARAPRDQLGSLVSGAGDEPQATNSWQIASNRVRTRSAAAAPNWPTGGGGRSGQAPPPPIARVVSVTGFPPSVPSVGVAPHEFHDAEDDAEDGDEAREDRDDAKQAAGVDLRGRCELSHPRKPPRSLSLWRLPRA
jgi:hypothetical protein